jgi:Secretion system C-terminal sorting domain
MQEPIKAFLKVLIDAAIEFLEGDIRRVGIYRSQNKGSNWIRIPVDSTEQGDYSVALAVAPADDSTIFFGNTSTLRRVKLSITSSGSLASTPTWRVLARHNGTGSMPDVHADYHQILFDTLQTGTAYFCNDGGLFKSIGINSADPTFLAINQNLRIVQFQTCAMSGDANNFEFLGGSQDNSMHQFNSAGCLTNSVKFPTQIGDGGYGFINPYNPDQRVASAFYNYYLVSNNRGFSFQSTGIWDSLKDATGQFINPTDWSVPGATATSPVNMFSSSRLPGTGITTGRLYRWNNIFSPFPTRTNLDNSLITSTPTAIKVSPNNSNTVYLGISDYGVAAKIVKVTNANSASPTFTNITGSLAQIGYISCIEVKKQATGDQELVVTFSNYGINSVYYTQTGTNSSPNWIPIDGVSLPDIPVRWALFAPTDTTANPYNYRILLATEAGVWATTSINTSNGPATTWQSVNNGDLPNVPVYMLRYRESDKLVLAATHGRGMWRSDMFSPIKVNFRVLAATVPGSGCPQTFVSCTQGTISSYAWDFQKDGTTDATTSTATTSAHGNSIRLAVNGTGICVAKDRADLFQIVNPATICAASSGGKGGTSAAFASMMSLYPNPTTSLISIETVSEIKSVDLYNLAGQLVANYGTEKAFDMQNQVAGIYFCKVTFADGQMAAQKIIKK